MEHLQQISAPNAIAQIRSHTKGFQFLIPLFHDRCTAHSPKHINNHSLPLRLIHPRYCAKSHLSQFCTVNSQRWILAHVAIVTIMVKPLIEIAQQDSSSTHFRFCKLLHALQFLLVYSHLTRILHKMREHCHIAIRIKHQSIRRQSIPSCPTYLLIIALKIFRHIVVNHPPDIALVNPHAKCYRGAYYFRFIVEKTLLYCLSNIIRQSGMITFCIVTFPFQSICHFLCRCPA